MPGRLSRILALALLLGSDGLGCRARPEHPVLVGTVERTLVEMNAPVSEQVAAVEVERGQHVAPGQVLVRLDSTLARAAVARAEATVAGARTGLAVARNDLERARTLRSARTTSEQELDRARLAYDEARARLHEAQAELRAAKKREADLILRAPCSGVVDQIPFDPGERVPPGAVLCVLLADGDPWVRVWIPERLGAQVGPGTPARVEIDGVPGVLAGRVLDVAREPEFTPHYALTERERVSLVYETRVEIHGAPSRLRPGIPARVVLEPGSAPATPRAAPAEGG